MSQQLPLNRRLWIAAQLVLRSLIALDIWFYYTSEDTRPAIFDTMDEYPNFFVFEEHAQFVAFVVQLACLFDRSNGTISLPRLAREMKSGHLIAGPDASEVDALFAQAAPLVEKLNVLRHEAFAHRSAAIDYDDAFKKAAVTYGQLRELAETALKIANQFSKARGLGEHFHNELPRKDAERILKALTREAAGAR